MTNLPATAVPESVGLPEETVGTPWNSADEPGWQTSALASSSSWVTRYTGHLLTPHARAGAFAALRRRPTMK
jgi:hypothetical protein